MLDRKSLVLALWLTTSLALLASVLVAPIRTSGFITVSSRPDCLRRNFALPSGQSTAGLGEGMATDAVLEVNALLSENEREEDLAGTLADPRAPFLIPCSFHKVPNRQLIAPLSILSLYPLRC